MLRGIEMASLVIEVPKELETQLHQMANELGVPVPELVRSALETLVVAGSGSTSTVGGRTREERAAQIDAVLAGYGHLPGSVDEFLRRKHEDTEREEQRLAERSQNGGSP